VSDYADGSYPGPRNRPRRRRRGRWGLFLIGLLLLLAAVAVVGDRVAAKVATDELRAQMVSELSDNNVGYESLDVTIGGFPFLTQVARGNYDEITIDLSGVKLPAERTGTAKEVTLPHLHVVASGVAADTQQVIEGTAKVNAKQVTGTAVVSFATLQGLVDFSALRLSDVAFAEEQGGLKVSAKTTVGGVIVPLSATADIAVAQGQLQVKLRDLQAVNLPVPTVVRDYLGNLAQQSLSARLPQLPFGLTLDQVTVDADGLSITATGHDVPMVN
jgi:hypothetical protein